jgi:L-amino acid N-acyltransferase YncA
MNAEHAVIRAAGPADLDAVAAIYAHYVTTSVATFEEVPPTPADWRLRFDDLAGRRLPFLVVEDGVVEAGVAEAGVAEDGVAEAGGVRGYAYAGPWRPKPAYRYTVEDTVYVSPAHLRRGLGGALLGALLAACTDAGARQVIAVIVDAGDDASLALHRRFGFAQAGRLSGVGRKQGRWLDTVLMQRELA